MWGTGTVISQSTDRFSPLWPWARIMSTTGIGIACMLHTYCSSAAAATATAAAAAAALGIVASLSVQF